MNSGLTLNIADEAAPLDGWVDGFWHHLDAAAAPYVEKRFAAFVRQRAVSKWIIATDFCIRDQSRPNDALVFVVLPAGDRYEETLRMLEALPARDLKDVSRIPAAIQRVLTDGRVFTFCLVADRHRRLFENAAQARTALDDSIAIVEAMKHGPASDQILADMRAMRVEAGKTSLNLRLIEDIVITAAAAAYVAALAVKHGNAELVGWVPDRDKITEAYRGIATTLYNLNVTAICDQWKLRPPVIGVFHQKSDNLWCDPYIRLADYIAGAAAAWDPPHANRVPAKIATLVSKVLADNRYLGMFRVAFAHVGERLQVEIRRVKIRPRGNLMQKVNQAPALLGRSRELRILIDEGGV